MDKEAFLKSVVQELKVIADRISENLPEEDNIKKMEDMDIILRSIALILYNIPMGMVNADAILEMCESTLLIAQKYGLSNSTPTDNNNNNK